MRLPDSPLKNQGQSDSFDEDELVTENTKPKKPELRAVRLWLIHLRITFSGSNLRGALSAHLVTISKWVFLAVFGHFDEF